MDNDELQISVDTEKKKNQVTMFYITLFHSVHKTFIRIRDQ
jgi:hypothetical protein